MFIKDNPGVTALIVSKTERQGEEMLLKTLKFLQEMCPARIGRKSHKVLKHRVYISHPGNKWSRVMCLPVGVGATGILGLTVHKLTIEEAEVVPDEVVDAIMPMLLTTGGHVSYVGTPRGKKGHFWKAFENKKGLYKVFRVNSEDVIRQRPICATWTEARRDAALRHLERERERMSAKMYQQEYLAEFIEGLGQYFTPELIQKCCILKRPTQRPMEANVMGSDLARYGGDEITYEIFDCREKVIRHVENIMHKEQSLVTTENQIRELNLIWNLKKIGIDAGSGAIGVSVYDMLTECDPKLSKKKVLAMNNRSISLNKDGSGKQRIFKEDMYENLRVMMEKGEILLLDDEEVKASLASVQVEIENEDVKDLSNPARERIVASYGHIVEGIVRGAYIAKKEKINKFRITWF